MADLQRCQVACSSYPWNDWKKEERSDEVTSQHGNANFANAVEVTYEDGTSKASSFSMKSCRAGEFVGLKPAGRPSLAQEVTMKSEKQPKVCPCGSGRVPLWREDWREDPTTSWVCRAAAKLPTPNKPKPKPCTKARRWLWLTCACAIAGANRLPSVGAEQSRSWRSVLAWITVNPLIWLFPE